MSLLAVGVFFLVFFSASIAGIVAIVRATMKKSQWGINLQAVRCPQCGAQQPRVRKPANARQAMWGGSTCAACGAEHDKWGRLLTGK